MNSPGANSLDAGQCPLCGRPNLCQLCTTAAYKGPCWCARVKIPEALIGQVPPELKDRACICEACVTTFHRAQEASTRTPKILSGDFYFDLGGLMVFTSQYHLRRGYCCGSGCRHCPYHKRANS